MTDVFKTFPVLDLGDIVLREIVRSDVELFFEYIVDPKVSSFIAEEDTPKNLVEAERELMYWADLFTIKRSLYWGIAKKSNNHLIGTCGFNIWSRTHARTEISYDLSRKEWGKGIMTRSVRAICDFAFLRMKVNRIQATVAHYNKPSLKLLERLEFQREGNLRKYSILKKEPRDFYMYSLIVDDMKF